MINCNEEAPTRKDSMMAVPVLHCPIHEPHPQNRQPSVDMTNQPKMRVNLATIDHSELLPRSLRSMRPNSPSNKPASAFVPLVAPVRRHKHPDENVRELLQLFDKTFDVLQNKKIAGSERVLIASRHGSDIACAVAAAYIVRDKHFTMEEAMRYVAKARPSVKLSKQSRAALHKYAQQHAQGPYICEPCRQQKQRAGGSTSTADKPADDDSNGNEATDEIVSPEKPQQLLRELCGSELSRDAQRQCLAAQLQQIGPQLTTIDLSCSRVTVAGLQALANSVKVAQQLILRCRFTL